MQSLKDQTGLCTLAKLVVELSQDVSVPHIVVVDVLDDLCTAFFADWNLLDPALDVLLGSKLQHSNHLWPVTNVRSTEVSTVWREVLCHHLRKGMVAESNAVKATVNFQGTEIILKFRD